MPIGVIIPEPDEGVEPGSGPMLPIENQAARGFHFVHVMLLAMDQQNYETRAIAEELARFLIARGLIGEEEWRQELEHASGHLS